MTATQTFVAGDGCKIAYRLDGAANLPVLTLSNSIATTHRMWDGQAADLSRDFRLLRYDTRGHGGSDTPAGDYSLDRLGRDVVELLDALDIGRTHFCGLSLGGFVGQWMGIHASDRLDRLVLSNTSPYLGPSDRWDELIRSLREEPDMAAMAEMFLAGWFPGSMIEQRHAAVELFRLMILATDPQGLAGSFAVVRDADLRRTDALIDVPTLVIGGKDDKVTLASHSEQIAQIVPGASLAMLPGVHMLNVEARDDFLRLVSSFLLGR